MDGLVITLVGFGVSAEQAFLNEREKQSSLPSPLSPRSSPSHFLSSQTSVELKKNFPETCSSYPQSV